MAKIWLYPNFALILCHKQNCHMKFEIKELEELSGKKARIYSVIIDGEEDTLLEQFFNGNKNHADELQTMLSKIKTMADDTGCRRQFFAEGEGAWADGVVALKAGKLRLYGIYFNNTVVLFGSGGWKNVRAYQDDPELNAKAQQVREIAKRMNKAIREREILIGGDGEIDTGNWEDYE